MQLVLADDLTGAAEIAALGFSYGLRSAVYTGEPTALSTALLVGDELLVINTDTRLMNCEHAERRLLEFLEALSGQTVFFKKIDSLLRGNVMAEIEAFLDRPEVSGVALLPQNPSLGRTLSRGIYYVDGIPLAKSGLAQDPDYPAKTSKVMKLLSRTGTHRSELARAGTKLSGEGKVYCCEAETLEEVGQWAGQLPAHMLPVGGSDFFRAVMENRLHVTQGSNPLPDVEIPEIAFYISGSAHPVSKTFFDGIANRGIPSVVIPGDRAVREDFSTDELQGELRRGLETHPALVLRVGNPVIPGREASATILELLVSVASSVMNSVEIPHFYLEGGATAAALLKAYQWNHLKVVKDWGQGAVTLQCEAGASGNFFYITLKPSSFPWPDALVRFTASQHT